MNWIYNASGIAFVLTGVVIIIFFFITKVKQRQKLDKLEDELVKAIDKFAKEEKDDRHTKRN